jgi:hypothetical protein
MGLRHLSNAKITKRKQSPSIANTTFAPNIGSNIPPIDGRIIPETSCD